MAYTITNFKTKKELKAAVASGQDVRCYQPGLGQDLSDFTGIVCLEGPHYPLPHKWYAEAHLNHGVVKSIK